MRGSLGRERASISDAYRLAAIEDRNTLDIAARNETGVSRVLLRAVVAQYDGDVDRAVMLLKRQLSLAATAGRGELADVLAPMLIMRHDMLAVQRLSEVLDDAGWHVSAYAFRALVAAETGRYRVAERNVARCKELLTTLDDDVLRFRVLQRVARASFFMKRYENALEFAAASASICVRHNAWRAASSSYSIAYIVHHAVTGDMREAARFARLCYEAAARSGDASFTRTASVAEYWLAVQFADDLRIRQSERMLKARLLPEQYAERFPLVFSQAIARGFHDLVSMRSLLQLLREKANLSKGQWALATALIAVSYAADHADEETRALIRDVIHHLGRPSLSDPAYEKRYRRLARASIAVACVFIGDDVRAARIVETRESQGRDGEHLSPDLVREEKWDGFPDSLKGIARIFKSAASRRRMEAPPAGLTAAEVEVLKLLASGYSAGRIASETQRSVNTIYNHTRSILTKLDASRAGEAVAIARKRGIIF